MKNHLHELTLKYFGTAHSHDSLLEVLLMNAFCIGLITVLLFTILVLRLFAHYAVQSNIRISWFSGIVLGVIILVLGSLYVESFAMLMIYMQVFK